MKNTMINGYSVVAQNSEGEILAFDNARELIESYGYEDLYDYNFRYYYIENGNLKEIKWKTIRNGKDLYPVIAKTQSGKDIANWKIRNH